MVQMMEFESHMPYKHRFRPAKFAERPTEELEKQRDYWCPWLFSQVIYHTIMCLLNHPLILSLRLRNFRVSIPEIFLQHTADLIASHTDWVIHFMDILEEKSFRVTDPFIGNCVAVVATIYLQQSFADDAGIRNEKRNNFLKCLNFVRKLGSHWPHIAQISSKLQHFEATVSASYRDSAASPSPDNPTQSSVFIDLTSFWEILEAVFTADGSADAAGSLFGASLWPHRSSSAQAAPRPEVVSSRLLPEPTYPQAGRGSVSTPTTTATAAAAAAGSGGAAGGATAELEHEHEQEQGVDQGMGGIGFAGDNDELAVLAQSYFAQGQDFVRGVDDWWTFGQ
ncbi:C6 transcription [Neofusicoccum parvum]|uniref:C6 transcription n=1 Tax=Neofusicoccum parvum TaxID=310453 RepID=A0ACB5RQJ2_9PEZI|nr:C6 transcription [Neofusicoccum parvum]